MVELFYSLSAADCFRMAAETDILTFFIYKIYMAVAEKRAKDIAVFIIGWAVV